MVMACGYIFGALSEWPQFVAANSFECEDPTNKKC